MKYILSLWFLSFFVMSQQSFSLSPVKRLVDIGDYRKLIGKKLAATAGGSRCSTPAEMRSDICQLEPAGTRCKQSASQIMARNMCKKEACPPTAGGTCSGFLGSGYWFTVSIDGTAMRCQCGCVAQETVFETNLGEMTAWQLVEWRDQSRLAELLLKSGDSFGLSEIDFFPIDNVMMGPEFEDVYTFTTESGKSITLTSAHPVVYADQDGGEQFMTKAEDVPEGAFLIRSNGNYELITSISSHAYEGQTVNFDMISRSRIVYPNDFKMGDNAWQQFLSLTDKRILSMVAILDAIDHQQ
ncbi:Hint domain-containing protein [Pseudobacteriovorax antillogorgiicola]|uniref:Intein N-terminal splicing region n=1 Tax=Pseudobacteriovorax antillogorgiicola TaxID=1513793 RepID=A0A1Y6BFV7_9BACT|nr:Hint domain-containing protein [Pseudobacteriovorax antillogorgiicola]TCS56267.1 intein [Pseudobacteriovorax antillogorgiicola]SMF07814.1 intein N-terminal splicing region [Pseudobacteriovorax antillogorgiicola]